MRITFSVLYALVGYGSVCFQERVRYLWEYRNVSYQIRLRTYPTRPGQKGEKLDILASTSKN